MMCSDWCPGNGGGGGGGVTTLTNAVSGQSQNCSGNLEIFPGMGDLEIFPGNTL